MCKCKVLERICIKASGEIPESCSNPSSFNSWPRLKKLLGSGRGDGSNFSFLTLKQSTQGRGGEDQSSKWRVRIISISAISTSDLLVFVCVLFILRLSPIFLMIISVAAGHFLLLILGSHQHALWYFTLHFHAKFSILPNLNTGLIRICSSLHEVKIV